MKQNNRAVGTNYEKVAGAYLESQGYEILEYNFCCRSGEIDIIAKDGAYLVFCEVKYRESERKGYPLEAISISKQRIISKCAVVYMTKHKLSNLACRFDVVGILGKEVTLLRNAFDYIES